MKEYKEEIEAVVGVLLVGAYLLGYIPMEVLVPVLGLLSASATASIKSTIKKANKVANNLSTDEK